MATSGTKGEKPGQANPEQRIHPSGIFISVPFAPFVANSPA